MSPSPRLTYWPRPSERGRDRTCTGRRPSEWFDGRIEIELDPKTGHIIGAEDQVTDETGDDRAAVVSAREIPAPATTMGCPNELHGLTQTDGRRFSKEVATLMPVLQRQWRGDCSMRSTPCPRPLRECFSPYAVSGLSEMCERP